MSKYEKYKPSGIDWIGKIPKHWNRKRLKDYAEIIMGQSPDSNSYNDEEFGVPFYQGKVDFGEFNPIPRIWCNQPTKISEAEDILISVRAPVGELNIANEKCCIGRGLTAVRIKKGVRKFAYYQFQIINEELKINVTGSTFEAVSSNDVSILKYIFPPADEQLSISNYLDRQTQKIDRLIANKKAQAEKLKELRQIEINNAVTKGLNPNAEMKDSGIDWLGKIPKHWEVKRLKNVSEKITDGEHIAPNFTDSGMPFLSAKDVRENEILFEEDKFVSEKDGLSFRQRCNPERGDALIVSRGATVGRVSIVKTDRIFCLLGSVILIKPTNKINSEFLFYALTNPKIQENLYQTSQSSAQQAIYLVNISFLKLAIPPIEEQIEISKVLVGKTKLIDNLIKNIENQIEKLQELRKINIYEAVTGKIKVNGYERRN